LRLFVLSVRVALFVSFAMRAVYEARHMAKHILPLGEPPATGYLRQSQLIPGILPFSSATLWRMVKKGTFPVPVKISPRCTAWRSEDVAAWMQARDTQPVVWERPRAKPEAESARRTSSGRKPAQNERTT
jgi:prophage regulatory protein